MSKERDEVELDEEDFKILRRRNLPAAEQQTDKAEAEQNSPTQDRRKSALIPVHPEPESPKEKDAKRQKGAVHKGKKVAAQKMDVTKDEAKELEQIKHGKWLSWSYDDGSVGGVVVDKNKKKFAYPKLKSKTDIDKTIEVLIAYNVKPGDVLTIPSGVKIFSDAYHQKYWTEPKHLSAFEAFKSMTMTGQSNEDILRLVCVILSSYMIQYLLKLNELTKDFKIEQRGYNALHVVVSESENAYYYLRQLCETMIVNTAVNDYGKLKLVYCTDDI